MTNLELKTTLWDTEENWETYKNEILLDGQKVGEAYIMIDQEEDDQAYLEDFGINKEHRNQGIGTEVLNKLVEKHGRVYMAPTDENNQRLYDRLGEEWIGNAPEVDQGYGVYVIE